jgi:hypothetical protein
MIDYYLKSASKDEVTLDILDKNGQVVRHLSSKEKKENEQPPEWPDRIQAPRTIPAKEGMNRFAWDLHFDDPVQIPGAFYSGEGPRGPLAPPGDYQVRLTAAGKSQTAPLHLAVDPRMKNTEATLPKQFELSSQVTARIMQLHQAVNEIRDVKSQIANLHKRFGENEKLKPALVAADDLQKKMSAVEEKLIQVNMKGSEGNLAFPNMLNEEFDTFSHVIDYADNGPTQPQYEIFKGLSTRLDEQLQQWAQLKNDEVPKVSAMIKQADIPALVVKAEAPK